MNLIKRAVTCCNYRRFLILTAALFLLSCGIEDFYYLPQVSESGISRDFNTGASVTIPSINKTDYFYASGYVIFYRIYLSTANNGSLSSLGGIHSTLASHYAALEPYTDPTKVTTVETSTFRSRGYYELEIEGSNMIDTVLSDNGGSFTINFPLINDAPFISFNGTTYRLIRSTGGEAFNPVPVDRYFFNTSEIRNTANAISSINADVQSSSNAEFAYVSMYIAVVGRNQRNFSRIYGKPAFINVFKLTE